MQTSCVRLTVTICLAFFASSSIAGAASGPEHGREYYESRGDIVWEVPGDEKILALTFDDGPDPMDTPKILDVLKQYEAKATFFTIGRKVRKYPHLAKREIAEGHELANHTFNHRFLGPSSSVELIDREIAEAQVTILATTGKTAYLFRPPGGVYNSKVVEAAKKEHLQVVMWSGDTRDWSRPGVGRIVRRVLRNTRNGDIILFHDSVNGTTQTVHALKIILPVLKERGYRFVTVSELLNHTKAVW